MNLPLSWVTSAFSQHTGLLQRDVDVKGEDSVAAKSQLYCAAQYHKESTFEGALLMSNGSTYRAEYGAKEEARSYPWLSLFVLSIAKSRDKGWNIS